MRLMTVIAIIMSLTLHDLRAEKSECQSSHTDSKYSVSFIWVNKAFNKLNTFIFGYDNEKTKEFLEWMKKNPHATFYFWYDSASISIEQLRNTESLFARIRAESHSCNNIVLKDIREIPLVHEKPEIFSGKTPVFFRADLLRLMITAEFLDGNLNKDSYFIYSDLDVPPIEEDRLLDSETLRVLDQFGIVLAKMGPTFENVFHIVSLKYPLLSQAIKTMVSLQIKRAEIALRENKDIDPEMVYRSYKMMLAYFYHLQGWGSLYLDDSSTAAHKILEDLGINLYPKFLRNFSQHLFGVRFDVSTHGLSPFNIHSSDHDGDLAFDNANTALIFEASDYIKLDKKSFEEYRQSSFTKGFSFFKNGAKGYDELIKVPVKPMTLPPIRGGGWN